MAAISTKNLQILLEKGGSARVDIAPTAIAKEKGATFTLAAVTDINPGDLVIVKATGFSEIDGNAYFVQAVDSQAKTVKLGGADTTGSTGTLSAAPAAQVIKRADMVRLCLSQFDIGNPSTNTTDVSTFCGDASLPGAVTPGSITMGGYASPDDEGLKELIKAEADAQSRGLLLILPAVTELANGAFVGEVSFSGLGYALPLNGAVGYTITATQSRKFAYRF